MEYIVGRIVCIVIVIQLSSYSLQHYWYAPVASSSHRDHLQSAVEILQWTNHQAYWLQGPEGANSKACSASQLSCSRHCP